MTTWTPAVGDAAVRITKYGYSGLQAEHVTVEKVTKTTVTAGGATYTLNKYGEEHKERGSRVASGYEPTLVHPDSPKAEKARMDTLRHRVETATFRITQALRDRAITNEADVIDAELVHLVAYRDALREKEAPATVMADRKGGGRRVEKATCCPIMGHGDGCPGLGTCRVGSEDFTDGEEP